MRYKTEPEAIYYYDNSGWEVKKKDHGPGWRCGIAPFFRALRLRQTHCFSTAPPGPLLQYIPNPNTRGKYNISIPPIQDLFGAGIAGMLDRPVRQEWISINYIPSWRSSG